MKSFRTIAEQHPESVALVFQRHFINAPSTERNLTNAIKIKGEVFAYDLAEAIENEQNSFLGIFESKEKRAAKKAARDAKRAEAAQLAKENPQAAKKGFSLDKALSILNGVAGVAGAVFGNKNANAATAENDLATDRILGIDRNMFFILAGLALVVLIMVARKSK